MSASRATAPLAAIDVGSNTIHLTAAQPLPGSQDVEVLADQVELVRLGADVNATGAIGAERCARAIEVIRHQAEVASALGAVPLLGIATEGVRSARNGAEFVDQVRAATGVTLEMVTGDQEAALTYWGAISERDIEGHRAVIDLGGGSLELVVGDGTHVAWRVSLPLGSGRPRRAFGSVSRSGRDVAPADAALAGGRGGRVRWVGHHAGGTGATYPRRHSRAGPGGSAGGSIGVAAPYNGSD